MHFQCSATKSYHYNNEHNTLVANFFRRTQALQHHEEGLGHDLTADAMPEIDLAGNPDTLLLQGRTRTAVTQKQVTDMKATYDRKVRRIEKLSWRPQPQARSSTTTRTRSPVLHISLVESPSLSLLSFSYFFFIKNCLRLHHFFVGARMCAYPGRSAVAQRQRVKTHESAHASRHCQFERCCQGRRNTKKPKKGFLLEGDEWCVG